MNNAGQFFTNRVLKDWKEKSRVSMIKYNILSITDLFPHSLPHIYPVKPKHCVIAFKLLILLTG